MTKWRKGYDYMKAHREGFIKFVLIFCLITCLCALTAIVPLGIAVTFYLKGQGLKNGGSANQEGDKNFDFDAVPDVSS